MLGGGWLERANLFSELSAFAARRAKQSNSVPDESIHESIKDAISEEGRANPNRSSIASGKREPSPSHFDGLTVETNIEVYSQTEVASVRFDKRQPASRFGILYKIVDFSNEKQQFFACCIS